MMYDDSPRQRAIVRIDAGSEQAAREVLARIEAALGGAVEMQSIYEMHSLFTTWHVEAHVFYYEDRQARCRKEPPA